MSVQKTEHLQMTKTNVAPQEYRLRLPGPTAVPERVRAALSRPMVSHRGPEFRAILAETTEMLRRLFRTKGDVFLLGGSGTAAMEAAIVNVLAPGDAVLVVVHGQFGERFVTIAEAMGALVDRVDASWGEAPDVADIAERMKQSQYRAVVCVHNETSSGVVADIAGIGALLRNTPTLLVVDAVSSIGGIDVRMDDWGADIVVAASQKALMCPPGLACAAVSEKAMRMVESANAVPRFFLDFRKLKVSADKGETPFTPPVSLVYGLREALMMIEEERLENVLARHDRLAAALRAGCIALGLPMFPTARPFSATTTVAVVPEGLEGGAIVRHLHANYGTVVAGQRTKLSGRVIRIGTMGAITSGDILTDLHHLELTLRDLGQVPSPGAGIRAASEVLSG
jgi:aspartate aminotransferase-like enzyme